MRIGGVEYVILKENRDNKGNKVSKVSKVSKDDKDRGKAKGQGEGARRRGKVKGQGDEVQSTKEQG